MLKFLFLIVILFYLLSVLFPILNIDNILSILCFVIVISTVWNVKRFVLLSGGIFLLLGIVMLWKSEVHWFTYIQSFGPMIDLVTMFTLVPILGIPLKLGEYSRGIHILIKRNVKTSGQLYMMTSGISYFFSIFMNIATLPIAYHAIKPSLSLFSLKYEERFMTRSITRGFAMPLIWAPVTPIVGIVIGMTGVSWLSILPYVFPLSLLGLSLDWFIGGKKSKKVSNINNGLSVIETAATIEVDSSLNRPERIFQIFLAIFIFVAIISIAETFLSYSFLTLVSFMIIPFSFTWSWLLRKQKEFVIELKGHFDTFSIKMKDQFFIYLSAGFFISAMKISHTNEILVNGITQITNYIGGEYFLIILPLIPLSFAYLGLHPAVTLALMAGALNPTVLDISPHILTVAMLAGAVSAFLVGPYNATIGLMSNIVKESSFKVSNWNLSFTAIYIAMVMIYLFLLELIIM